jgi:uncharacterized protein YdeI (BOF family)
MKTILQGALVVLGLCLTPIAPVKAEEFNISIGDTVSDDVPVQGAGRLSTFQEEDVYTFTASAGQLVFVESLDQDAAFQRSLRWQLLRPIGQTIFSSFFHNPQGRTALPDAGMYKIRVYTDKANPGWIGSYSFRLLPIPPDQTFALTLGELVADGIPAPGAGRLEMAGAEDIYVFNGIAGQLVFFEPLTRSAALQNSLRWQLIRPDGQTVFSSFFSNLQGRTLLPETGEYKVRVYTSGTDATWFGVYSFRAEPIAPDQTFSYEIGTTVSDDVPAAGAGKLEQAGTEDHYVFSGNAGQIIFFESIRHDEAFGGSLRWQLIRPNGQTVFSSFFSNAQGRTVLPEAGDYRIRIFTDGTQSAWKGSYSFTTRGDVSDHQIAIRVGDIVSDGQPVSGAGRIETPGSQDVYTFEARAGQIVIFESLNQAPAFQNNLRWQLIRPSGQPIFSSFFSNPQGRTFLPEEGTYRIRIFTDGTNPNWTGEYSFRTYSRVQAGPDNAATTPNRPVLIPFAKLLFNDTAENAPDTLSVMLPSAATLEGGTVSHETNGVLYTPKANFSGIDRFTYQLQGEFGGTNDTIVRVAVTEHADEHATVVSWVWRDNRTVEVCLMGEPNAEYELQTSSDLNTWLPIRIVSEQPVEGMTFPIEISTTPGPTFFRASRRP